MSFNIIGTGSAVPKLVLTNADLSKFMDTSDEWISSRTGIRERHILNDENLLDLSVKACQAALKDAGIRGDTIDMIICSTIQGDYITPAMSCLISKEINVDCRYVFDINMGCSGFIYALDMAAAYFAAGKAKRILVVCPEAISRMVDWQDRSTCVLFGDGVGAVVLEAGDSLLTSRLSVDGSMDHLNIPAIAGNNPYLTDPKPFGYLHMNGPEIYKFAVSTVTKELDLALTELGFSADDMDYFILHQANIRIIEAIRARLNQKEEKFPHNIECYGNTSSASIPILLDELNKKNILKKGDLLLLAAFGAGLVTGVCIVKWNKN